ncbi:MAG: A/G-specific adenine glycosylase [Bacilli bacterium]|nr:A/G-specific adenine glycosylase [Bacilli bacterium]
MKNKELEKIIPLLLSWYDKNKRDLPWRRTKDAYKIWVSEIMLQQTRVEAVIPYFERFIHRLPTLTELAKIEEEQLLKLWEGLGYYSRVKNMQKCAIELTEKGRDTLPIKYEELLKLPGIGPYTAGAIASIAFNEKVSAVDGNVLRVITRLTASTANISQPKVVKEIQMLLNQIMPIQSGNFNQALMELGATICIPGSPRCNICPLQKECVGYQKGTMWTLPIKDKKKKQVEEEKTVFLLFYKNKIAIQKRPNKGLLASLWEFPNREGHLKNIDTLYPHAQITKTGSYKHVFTHKIWKMEGYSILLKEKPKEKYTWVTMEELLNMHSLPSAFKYFLQDIQD